MQFTDIQHHSSEFISRVDYDCQRFLGLRQLVPSTYPWNFDFKDKKISEDLESDSLTIKLLSLAKTEDVPSALLYNIFSEDSFVLGGMIVNKHKPASLGYQTFLTNMTYKLKNVSVKEVIVEIYDSLGWVCHTRQAVMARHDSEIRKLLKNLKTSNPDLQKLEITFRHNPDVVKAGYHYVINATRSICPNGLLIDCDDYYRDELLSEMQSRLKFSGIVVV